jgi:L-proline amide hydrolase
MSPPASEGYVDYRGWRTWYRVVGDLASSAVPLLALHGGPGSTHHYFGPLERLGSERPVVLYDQIGCGSSDRPQDIEWSVAVFREEVDAVRSQVGFERIHLLGTSWGGMLALEHVLSGAEGIVSLILSSTLASIDQWAAEQLVLRNALPPAVVEVLDRHERAGTYDDPEYEQAMEAYFDRHFYRGPKPRPELERMNAEKARDVYRAMQGPNEWTVTGALRGWNVRDRLGEIDRPTLVIRGRHDMCTDSIADTLVKGIPTAREIVLEKSSHTPVLEESERYLETVSAFVRDSE